jgi:hypothetical protein
MRFLLPLVLLFAFSACALNQIPPPVGLFTADSDAPLVLARLWNRPPTYGNRPTVVISHDPWGEASIVLPPIILILNHRIAARAVRLITADVAIVDAACIDMPEAIPLLFVMKKEADDWKIASARILAPRPDFLFQ